MYLSTVSVEGARYVARLDLEREVAYLVDRGTPVDRPRGMQALINSLADGAAMEALDGPAVPFSRVTWCAPIPIPRRNIICVGKNYRAHAVEFANSGFDSSTAPPAESAAAAPIVFTKASNTVIAHGDIIRVPQEVTRQVDYEAELALIIGKRGRNISRAEAYGHVFGYTIVNDVTARDLQKRHSQWFIGKSIDTFCPIGPWLVTADQFDPENAAIRCWVNDELRQDANTRHLIFDIPELIATISAGMTLEPGDIIATGTPEGVGIGFSPPKFLFHGDQVRIEIEGIGTLSNRVQWEN